MRSGFSSVYAQSMTTRAQYDSFIGTYTRTGGSDGIYQVRFRPEDSKLEVTGSTEFKKNPSFLVVNHSVSKLFSVCEMFEDRTGMVAAFDMARSGPGYVLEERSSAPTSGKGPCHLLYDEVRSRIVAANYGSGAVGVIAMKDDGTLESIQGIQHTGSSVDPKRQEGPHAHSVTADPTGKRVIVCDLGLDEVIVYEWNRETLLLNEEPVCRAKVEPGSGPRHFAFHPNGKLGYLANEMGNTVAAFTYDGSSGELASFQTIGSLPDEFSGNNTTADIHLDSAGSKLYISNRGHDSIAVFDIDPTNGTLSALGHIATAGREPRNFAITPDDRYVFAANQNTDSIAVFDRTVDVPAKPIARVDVPAPVCIQFA